MLTSTPTPDSQQTFFNKEETIRHENAAALILARALLRLEEVVWSNPWADETYSGKNTSCRIVRHRHRDEKGVEGEGEYVEVVRDGEAYADVVPPSAGSIIARGVSCGAAWLL